MTDLRHPRDHDPLPPGLDAVREAIAARCATAQGRRVAARMAPLEDFGQARVTLDQTGEMRALLSRRPEALALGEVADLQVLLAAPAAPAAPASGGGGVLTGPEAASVLRTLEAVEALRTALEGAGDDLPLMVSVAKHLAAFPALREALLAAVDRQGGVLDGAAPRLAGLRAELRQRRDVLRRSARGFAYRRRVAALLAEPEPVRLGERQVLVLRSENRGRMVRGVFHGTDGPDRVLFEPDEVVVAGNHATELASDEAEEVRRVLEGLTAAARAEAEPLLRVSDAVAWIDFTRAKALWAEVVGAGRPLLEEGGPLALREARDPVLVQRALAAGRSPASEVLPVTLDLGDAHDALVVSGPNTGGKSTVLRTLALAATLVRCGCPFPCGEGTRLPFCRPILMDLGGSSDGESPFASHLERLLSLADSCGRGALVLLDDLGWLTDPEEGAVLAGAILESIIEKGALVLATTHLGALRALAERRPRVANAFVDWDVARLAAAQGGAPAVVPTSGRPGASRALEVAARLGLPEAVLERARSALAGGEATDPLRPLLERLDTLAAEARRFAEEAGRLHAQAAQDAEAAATSRTEAEALRGSLQREADAAMESFFGSFRGSMADLERAGQGVGGPAQEAIGRFRKEADGLLGHTPFARRREDFGRGLKKGDRVWVVPAGARGEVTRVNHGQRRVTVMLGRMTFEATYDQLSWVGREA
ncbi:MAG: hypothetical protein HY722_13600 [Planctomycetes bacterium]|nr:hypothetical protein [Planctomycetota bacterium]